MSDQTNGNGNGGGNGSDRRVTFIQYDIPPLKSGEYTVTVEETVNQPPPNNVFTSVRQFAVAGERFTLDPADYQSIFPPNLANGEYEGVLPQVAFARETLPWERTSVAAAESAPWLAVLLFNPDEAPRPAPRTARDLVTAGAQITVAGSDTTGTGTLPANYLSYPGMSSLDYGETPDDACMVIDLPLEVFNRVVPSAEDLPYLAQIREVDTTSSQDHTQSSASYAIVMGNRVARNDVTASVFLVSLENMGPLLPASDGTPSAQVPAGTTHVRLLAYRWWTFTANTLGETFQHLAEGLNQGAGQGGLATLRLPNAGQDPTPDQVQAALAAQAAGTLTAAGAQVLVANAFAMGYVPLSHHLRHAGQTVSWYRGPLVPYSVPTTLTVPLAGPDAANRYDPQTGLFDVSYGAAWQLGQLLALQNTGYATALYAWKRTVQQSDAVAEEQALIDAALDPEVFPSFALTRAGNLAAAAPPPPPDVVVKWIACLRLLNGVPFQYLVPDERMLPQESLRLFYLDLNWVDALVDGAFSIGRASTGEAEHDATTLPRVHQEAVTASRLLRLNAAPSADYVNATGQVTGFLLRSQVVSGWPRMGATGFADLEGNTEVPHLRMVRLSGDVLLCLFDGVVQMVALHEPPEQLHSGVEGAAGAFTTTLRAVTGATPGKQFLTDPRGGDATAAVPTRADGQTLMARAAADSITRKLNTDFGQGITVFTSAEFALEMVKGVVEVEFQQRAG